MRRFNVVVVFPFAENNDTEKADDENHADDDTDTNKNITVIFTEIIDDLEHCFGDIIRQV